LRAEDQFHVGVVVNDVEAALTELSAMFGYQWCDELGGPIQVRLPAGDAVLNLRCVYSRSSPRLEIVGHIPGTVWEPAPGSGIHHVGYWSDDVAADSAELERHGYVAEATSDGADGVPLFGYYRSATGFRIELVSRIAQPGLERHWAARAQPAGGDDA
jgi:hypothetical protein